MEKHHVTPVHKGGKDGPTVELNPWEHAEVHAERFLNGEDDWFHMRFLKYLDYETSKKVRKKMGKLQEDRWKDGTHPFQPVYRENGRKSGQIAVETGQVYEFQRNGSESWKSPFYMFDMETKEEFWFESQLEFEELFGFGPGYHIRENSCINKRYVFRYDWDSDYCYVPVVRGKTTYVLDTLTGETLTFKQQYKCSEFLGVSSSLLTKFVDTDRLFQDRYQVFRG